MAPGARRCPLAFSEQLTWDPPLGPSCTHYWLPVVPLQLSILGFRVSAVHARHFFCLSRSLRPDFSCVAKRSPAALFLHRCSWRLGTGDSRRYVAVVAPPSRQLVAAAVLVMSLIVSKRLFRFRNLWGCVVSLCPKLQSRAPPPLHTSWALKPWSRFPEEKKFLSFSFSLSLYRTQRVLLSLSSCDIIVFPLTSLSRFLSLRTSGAVYPTSLSYIPLPLYLYLPH
jgi:hypothetical protein